MRNRYAYGYDVKRGMPFWKVLFSFNSVQPVNAAWYDHYFRDAWYNGVGNGLYNIDVPDHIIHSEDLKPRDFVMVDNKVLSKVCC
ncbi:unnamed protein product [Soboliphyme baturini]|uniref:PKD_channel domain-containing protein n=1 Tax=Soboliphyme baturini TaxID=241478 RepID=A0A183J6M5_9BILA|nr:unnamed protein product [Soboliphyme baturini]